MDEQKKPDKPILFLFSSQIPLSSLYFMKDVGSVINLYESPVDLVMQYEQKDFVVCDMRDYKQVDKLKYVDLDKCTKVAVLRAHESVEEEWVKRLEADYKVKSFDWVEDCRSKAEILNTIKIKNVFKKPDSNTAFYLKKAFGLLSACLKTE